MSGQGGGEGRRKRPGFDATGRPVAAVHRSAPADDPTPATEDPGLSTQHLVLVMAKAPRPGAVKTRLCPPLTPGLAADLYRAFLRDTLATAAGLGVALGVVYPPVDDDLARDLRALLP